MPEKECKESRRPGVLFSPPAKSGAELAVLMAIRPAKSDQALCELKKIIAASRAGRGNSQSELILQCSARQSGRGELKLAAK